MKIFLTKQIVRSGEIYFVSYLTANMNEQNQNVPLNAKLILDNG